MQTPTHPIDAPVSRSLIAAVVLIVGLFVSAMAVEVHPRTGSVQGSSTEASNTVAEWGD